MKIRGLKQDYINIEVSPLEVIETILTDLNWRIESNNNYVDLDGNGISLYEDVSYHGSPNWTKVKTISDKADDIEAYTSLIFLKEYFKKKED